MKVQIIAKDGQIEVVTNETTYELGKKLTDAFYARLGAKLAGGALASLGEVEQHRPDSPHMHVADVTHTHGGGQS